MVLDTELRAFPYRSFDRKTDIFYQTDSLAFALELAPLMGADERTGDILAQLLSENMPAGARVQIIEGKLVSRPQLLCLARQQGALEQARMTTRLGRSRRRAC